MRILIVSNLYHPHVIGGAEKSTRSLAEALVLRGHEVSVVSLNPERKYKTTEIGGVKVHYLPVRNLYFPNQAGQSALTRALWHSLDSYNPFMGASVGRVLNDERPDVVNTHNVCGLSASVWRAVKMRRLPLVHTVRDYYVLCSRSALYRHGKICSTPCPSCRVYSWPRRRLSRLVDVVTGVSHRVLDGSCQNGCFPEAEKIVVHNAFEPQLDNGTHRNGRNGDFQFGYLGRLHPAKGIDLLIRSFLKLPVGRAKLLIAGRGAPEYEASLRGLIDGHPAIRMVGFVGPSDFFSRVDVSVVPSLWHEPAARVVLESVSHSVPVIGSCRGGTPELMGTGTGWIFDPDEPGALTRALQHAIESRGELVAMSDRAGERIRQFSTEAMVNGYLKAYSSAINKNKRNSKSP